MAELELFDQFFQGFLNDRVIQKIWASQAFCELLHGDFRPLPIFYHCDKHHNRVFIIAQFRDGLGQIAVNCGFPGFSVVTNHRGNSRDVMAMESKHPENVEYLVVFHGYTKYMMAAKTQAATSNNAQPITNILFAARSRVETFFPQCAQLDASAGIVDLQ